MKHRLYGQSVIWSQDFDPELLKEIFARADHFKEHRRGDCLRDKIVAMLFFEKSTRTRFSFETAVQNLGGTHISTENARLSSSVAKGESLEDTIRVISAYCDAIVLRHHEDDAAMRARDLLQSDDIWVPIFNAGCGKGQHPTQSFMDLYTIEKEIGRLHDLRVLFFGDHANSRVVRSVNYLLGKFPGNHIDYVSPWELAIGRDMLAYNRRHNVTWTLGADIREVIQTADVVYVTRLQKERFADKEVYERLKHSYRLTVDLALEMKPGACIMHPLPKVDEIDQAVDRLPQAAYFRQSDNGVPIRKALLQMVLAEE